MKDQLGKWTKKNGMLELPSQISLYNLSTVELKNKQHKEQQQQKKKHSFH